MSRSALASGLAGQLELRSGLISQGHRAIGWKAGFGAPLWRERFRIDGPLVGFMTDATLVDDGAEIDISEFARPVAEPELAAYLGSDLPPGSGREETRAAISAIGPAIELADIDPPPDDVHEILVGNIFHRGVVLGRSDPSRAGADLVGLEARVRLDRREQARTNRLEDLTGGVIEVISHLSDLLADHGEMMRAGDVVICGSVVPPIDLFPGSTVEFELHPMEMISLRAL
ncbi:MAG TPA: fumarylacetoacetate hydrolase family protein [Acidimicrobiia bacterium]|nr:fumarylacetoacetate hydrolase family protein [Acidimicrobiia bacterium]